MQKTKDAYSHSVALTAHARHQGKIEVALKAPIRGADDFAVWYTPGVGEAVRAVMDDREAVYDLTNRQNTVAILTDGSRVLGFGNAGPEAALPVMEGKAMLFKYLGGVDAFPICIKAKTADDIVRVALALEPTFGAINLEDIASPKCFEVLETLRKKCRIPVWHDDQQGTAVVILAAMLNALMRTGRSLKTARIAMVGAGAANLRAGMLLMAAGVPPANMVFVDKDGILGSFRKDLKKYPLLWRICRTTNRAGLTGGIREAMRGADAVCAAAKCGPGVIKPDWVSEMAKDPIVFSLANPMPEIMPEEAKKAGARIAASGRSDRPNQVNNSLAFPSIMRGALDSGARRITDGMCLAAAYELARCGREHGFSDDHILPTMTDAEVFARVASVVGEQAVKEGVAKFPLPAAFFYREALSKITRARKETDSLARSGIIH